MTESSSRSQSAGWPEGISAITLFVEDSAATRKFFESVFELPVYFEDDVSTVFKFGDTLVNLLDVSAVPELIEPAAIARPDAGHRAVYTVGVADVDALCARLQARGVTLLNGPIDRPWGVRTASFVDPAGNIWEIAH